MKYLSNTLVIPVLVLLAVLATVIAAVKMTDNQAETTRHKLTTQQTQMRDAETRVKKSGAEKELIARYLPDYQKLELLGFLGNEQRINWLDALRFANQKGGLFGINYDLSARQSYPYAALLNPGQINVMQSVMKLHFPMLHEEDLQKFFANLSEQNAGVFVVDQCTVRRTGITLTTRFQPNLTAECQLAWITVQAATTGEMNP